MGDQATGRLKVEDLRLKVGYLKGRLKEELKGWLEGRLKGGLRGDLPPQNPFARFKFFLPLHCPLSRGLRHCPLSGGLHSPSPEALGKSLYMPTLLKTPSPERLLRSPPLASPPFFLPLHPLLRRPRASLCTCGRGSLRSPQPHIQKLAPLMLPPSYRPSLKPLPRNAF